MNVYINQDNLNNPTNHPTIYPPINPSHRQDHFAQQRLLDHDAARVQLLDELFRDLHGKARQGSAQ